MVDAAEVNQRRCIEESGQWLENVDRTHLVLASGELVLQTKNLCGIDGSLQQGSFFKEPSLNLHLRQSNNTGSERHHVSRFTRSTWDCRGV